MGGQARGWVVYCIECHGQINLFNFQTITAHWNYVFSDEIWNRSSLLFNADDKINLLVNPKGSEIRIESKNICDLHSVVSDRMTYFCHVSAKSASYTRSNNFTHTFLKNIQKKSCFVVGGQCTSGFYFLLLSSMWNIISWGWTTMI